MIKHILKERRKKGVLSFSMQYSDAENISCEIPLEEQDLQILARRLKASGADYVLTLRTIEDEK